MTTKKVHAGVLFADVSNSSMLYRLHGDEGGRRTVLRCLTALSGAVENGGGTVVDRIGDELMCRLDTADQTAAVAIEAQKALAGARVALDLPSSVGVRIGFCCGSVLVDEERLFGDTVYTAKRMASLAKMSQILTSTETVGLLDDAWKKRFRYVSELTIKGNVFEVFELIWDPGLSTEGEAPRRAGDATLLVQHGSADVSLGRERPVLTIGRDETCDLVIPDKRVSRLHGRIEWRKDHFCYVDLSTNGAFLLEPSGQEIRLQRQEHRLPVRGMLVLGNREQDRACLVIHFECRS